VTLVTVVALVALVSVVSVVSVVANVLVGTSFFDVTEEEDGGSRGITVHGLTRCCL